MALSFQSNILPVDVHALRRQDFSLSAEQQELRDVFAGFFEKECPSARVRAAEPLGFDAAFWQQLVAAGAVTMGLPEAAGGDGATLIDLVLVAEQFGRRVAPAPLIDVIAATRLLAAAGAPPAMIGAVADGERLATFAHRAVGAGERQLVSGGAVADIVVGLEAGVLVAFEVEELPAPVANLAAAPMAWRSLSGTGGSRTALAEGVDAAQLHATASREWKLLMAAAQTGIAQGALDLAVGYANERHAFGVPIGTFQAISHSLVDIAIGVEGSRRLNWRAAWFSEHEPVDAPAHVLMAYLYGCDVANRAAATGIHVQGGFGFTLESDMQLYFRRAKGWSLVTGDPQNDLRELGDVLYAPSA
jgi:alkylation response protein AidB-like acyl-CoA dehydrogenase